MSDLISRKAVEKIIKEFFKKKVDEIPKREKFNKLCDLCGLYLELNADLHKELDKIPTAYDVDKVVEQLEDDRQQTLCMADESEYFLGQLALLNRVIPLVKGGG